MFIARGERSQSLALNFTEKVRIQKVRQVAFHLGHIIIKEEECNNKGFESSSVFE